MHSITVLLNPEGTHAVTGGRDVTELTSVVLSAEEGTHLRDLAIRAQDEGETRVDDWRFLFVTEEDHSGARYLAAAPTAIVREDGLMAWPAYPWHMAGVKVGDLLRAKAAGLFDGDPSYIIIDRPDLGDGGVAATWNEVIDFLVRLGGVFAGIQAMRAAVRFAARLPRGSALDSEANLIAASAWMAEFLRRHSAELEQRGGSPGVFLSSVAMRQQWDSSTLRNLLGLELAEADRLLDFLGYDYDPSIHAYRLSSSASRKHVRLELLDRFLGYDPATWEAEQDQPPIE